MNVWMDIIGVGGMARSRVIVEFGVKGRCIGRSVSQGVFVRGGKVRTIFVHSSFLYFSLFSHS